MINTILASSGQPSMIVTMLVYVIALGGVLYLFAIKPQKKQQKEMEQMLSQLETGDSVLTTSGFYGTVIAIQDDTVIVEFGNNKNCRIPMQKSAIVDIEKESDGVE